MREDRCAESADMDGRSPEEPGAEIAERRSTLSGTDIFAAMGFLGPDAACITGRDADLGI
jgi:hypothetical protein